MRVGGMILCGARRYEPGGFDPRCDVMTGNQPGWVFLHRHDAELLASCEALQQ